MNSRYELSDFLINVKFKNNSNFINVKYRLYKNSVASKWLNLMMKTQLLEAKIIDNGIFFGNGVVDKVKVANELIGNVDFHNEFCLRNNLEDCRIPVTLDNPATQERLNLLHEYFEKYAEDPTFCQDIKARDNLQFLNLNIHRLESCLYGADSSHIEILHQPRLCIQLEDADYKLFTPDFKWGELYLTYGMTGVPTLNAYMMKSDPTPQTVITNGMMLAFWGDVEFKEKKEFNEFLKTKNMNPDDPKISFGYIPLGQIENIEEIDRKKLLSEISHHAFVQDVTVINSPQLPKIEVKPVSSASWPYDSEIYYHLDLVPYIDLNVKFDSKKLYAEAEKALAYFVAHRDYDQESKQTSGKWKSLALRGLFGDYTKTQYHTSYEFEGKPFYKNTIFSELCPETMKFLETITDIGQCERVRFMLLEPGASVKTHRDSQDKDVCLAVNISLNMPEGCVFHSQVNPDGTENPFTVKLPFKDSGSVLLFNNAKYHRVVNNSNTPRIHIIFHGPIKFNDQQLINLARFQNSIPDTQELIRKVLYKKNYMGEELDKNPILFGDWQITGLRNNSIPENYAFAIYDHDKYFDPQKGSDFYLKKRTSPTLFPLKYDVIKENTWDEYLKSAYKQNKEFVVIAAAGTFFHNLHQFIKHLVVNATQLKKKGWPAAGHLMDFNDNKILPYFHEQFIIVNLKVWHELGEIPLGPLYGANSQIIDSVHVSSEKIHDDYTPLFIKSADAENNEQRRGVEAWGSLLIKKAVESGKGVLNITQDLRKEKQYTYPRDEIKKPKEDVEQIINFRLDHSKNEVFYFNNEPLTVLKIKDFKPTKLISVSAGFKPFQIIKQFDLGAESEIHFTDFSINALNYMRELVKVRDFAGVSEKIKSIMSKDPVKKDNIDKVDSQLNNIVLTYFNNSKDDLMKAIENARKASFHEVNLIQNPDSVSSLLKANDKFVIWISNAFYNNSLFLLLTPSEAEQSLVNLTKSISRKTGLKAFKHLHSHSIVFGKTLSQIEGLLTDGALMESTFSEDEWKEIN